MAHPDLLSDLLRRNPAVAAIVTEFVNQDVIALVARQAFDGRGKFIDGLNVWETLIGKKDAKHPRKDLLYWHGSKGFHAIRVGDWKLFLDHE